MRKIELALTENTVGPHIRDILIIVVLRRFLIELALACVAEMPGELRLLIRRQILPSEKQQMAILQNVFQLPDGFGVERL